MATTPTKESKTSKLHSFLCVFDYFHNVNVNMLVTQLCLTLCDPMGCSLPGSSVHGILQARILEWVAISSPGDLPNLGIEPGSPSLQADCLLSEPQQNGLHHITWFLQSLWPGRSLLSLSMHKSYKSYRTHSKCHLLSEAFPDGSSSTTQWEEPFFCVLMSFSCTMLIAGIPFGLLR